jgi:thiamine biosynthesis protein ThiI
MDCDTVIVRYGEIFLKSDYVRRQFTRKLVGNIKHALHQKGLTAQVTERRHRIYLSSDRAADVSKRVSHVFGVVSASPAVNVASEPAGLTDKAVEYAGSVMAEGSFAVKARRTKDYPLTSKELEARLGQAIKDEHSRPVDLSDPNTLIGVEVQGGRAFLYSRTDDGVGGLPYGTQGYLAAVVEDGKGALAAWMMMRRGCSILLVGDGGYAASLSRYSNPDVQVFDGIGQALASGALGVVSAETAAELDTKWGYALGVPVYRPLVGLDSDRLTNIVSAYGLRF